MTFSNQTADSRTGDYLIGRGKVYLAPLVNNMPGAYRFVGNCPDFTLSADIETLEHLSAQAGLKTTDLEAVIRSTLNVSIGLEEFNKENLADWLLGESVSVTNAAIAGFTKFSGAIDSDQIAVGRSYDIVNASGVRAYDIDGEDLTVEIGATELVEGTDYEVDERWGRITLLDSDDVNAAVGGATDVDITLAAKSEAKVVEAVSGMTQTGVPYALKFVQVNANPDTGDDDEEREWQFAKVTLRPDGDAGLISDEWAKLTLAGKAQLNSTVGYTLRVVGLKEVGAS